MANKPCHSGANGIQRVHECVWRQIFDACSLLEKLPEEVL
jgi:hypothetical protein